MDILPQVHLQLRSLRMPGIVDNLSVRLAEANEHRLGYLDFLSLLLQDERQQRDNNQMNECLRLSGMGQEKTFEGFDWNFNPQSFPRPFLNDLRTCAFIDEGKNVVLAGPPGIGKTHLAKALGHEACRRKRRVLFRKTHSLFHDLSQASRPERSERLLKNAIRVDLLILDDFAFRRFEPREVDLLYALSDERQSGQAIIMTSNRPTEDWLNAFPDPVMGGAILDRLVSGAYKVIVKQARSYRKEGMPQPLPTEQDALADTNR